MKGKLGYRVDIVHACKRKTNMWSNKKKQLKLCILKQRRKKKIGCTFPYFKKAKERRRIINKTTINQ